MGPRPFIQIGSQKCSTNTRVQPDCCESAFTMDIYSHVGPNLQTQLAEQLAGLIDSSVEVR